MSQVVELLRGLLEFVESPPMLQVVCVVLQVPAHMFAGYAQAHVLTIEIMQGCDVILHNGELLFQRGLGRCYSCVQVSRYLPAQPGLALGSPADHDTCRTGMGDDRRGTGGGGARRRHIARGVQWMIGAKLVDKLEVATCQMEVQF